MLLYLFVHQIASVQGMLSYFYQDCNSAVPVVIFQLTGFMTILCLKLNLELKCCLCNDVLLRCIVVVGDCVLLTIFPEINVIF